MMNRMENNQYLKPYKTKCYEINNYQKFFKENAVAGSAYCPC